MSLIIDGVTVPATGNIRYGGTDIDKVVIDGVEVWRKQTTIVATPGSPGGETTGRSWIFYFTDDHVGETAYLRWELDLTNIKRITAVNGGYRGDAAVGGGGTISAWIEDISSGAKSPYMQLTGGTSGTLGDEDENYRLINPTISLDVSSLTGVRTIYFWCKCDNGYNNFNAEIMLGSITFSTD